MEEKDYEPYKRLFDEAYSEYLEFLKSKNPLRYLKERQERREVTRARFDFYLKTGSSFVAEKEGKVVGYVASQVVPFMHGADKLLWIEYIVVQQGFRKQGIGLALLQTLTDHAKHHKINRIYTTINPDNQASINLHSKAGFKIEDRKIATTTNLHT
jgi:RimJ/RimL family protein N-acetyltransferase